MLYSRNQYNIVNQLYFNKFFFKNAPFTCSDTSGRGQSLQMPLTQLHTSFSLKTQACPLPETSTQAVSIHLPRRKHSCLGSAGEDTTAGKRRKTGEPSELLTYFLTFITHKTLISFNPQKNSIKLALLRKLRHMFLIGLEVRIQLS